MSSLQSIKPWPLIYALVLFSAIASGRNAVARAQATSGEFEEVRTLLTSHRYDAAEQKLQAYLALHPESADAHFLMGYALFSERKAAASLAEYTTGAKYRDPRPEDLMAVAADYVLLSDYSDADKWFTFVTEMQPQNEQALYYLGRTRYYEGHYNDAIALFNKCLELSPNEIRSETNLGLAYEGFLRYQEAAAAYNKAIAWDETQNQRDPQPYLNLGSLQRRQGNVDAAIPLLQKAVALGSTNPKAREELARAYEQRHQNAQAQSELEKAIQLSPNVASLHFLLGRIYKAEGLKEKAMREFATTSQLNGTRSSIDVPNFDLPQ
jgi:tetratricopeptide (TPR) repeat protein